MQGERPESQSVLLPGKEREREVDGEGMGQC